MRSCRCLAQEGFFRVLAIVLLCWGSLAGAQSYPSKPVRLLVPFAAGGTADLAARVVGEQMAQSLGQPVVIENKPGAGGTLGTALRPRSPRMATRSRWAASARTRPA